MGDPGGRQPEATWLGTCDQRPVSGQPWSDPRALPHMPPFDERTAVDRCDRRVIRARRSRKAQRRERRSDSPKQNPGTRGRAGRSLAPARQAATGFTPEEHAGSLARFIPCQPTPQGPVADTWSGHRCPSMGTVGPVRVGAAGRPVAGVLVHIKDAQGANVLTFRPARTYQRLVLSSEKVQDGREYSLYTGGRSTDTARDGLITTGTSCGAPSASRARGPWCRSAAERIAGRARGLVPTTCGSCSPRKP
jgi:hypothetical protein